MKILAIILTVLMMITSIASASAEMCYSSNSSCDSSVEDCQKNSHESSEESQSSSDKSAHCHGVHACTYFYVQSAVFFIPIIEPINNQTYSFTFTQAFSDGPFRPPLV